MPIYKTMFSELRHHPRYTIQLHNTFVLPNHVNHEWPGRANYQRERQIITKM